MGLIAEMTFRSHPLAEMFRLAVVRCDDGELADACITSILSGRTRPVLMELVTPFGDADVAESFPAAVEPDGWTLVVGYEDCHEAVEWQCKHLGEVLTESVEALDEAGSQALYEALREWPGRPAAVAFKATMKSSQVVPFHAWAGERGFRLLSHAANGVVYGRADDTDSIQSAEDLAAVAADGGGHFTWTTLPPRTHVEIWQPRRGDMPVMRRIKETFDPRGIFAPGRWLDVT